MAVPKRRVPPARLRRDGRLLRTYKDGQAKLSGFLEDYAFLIDGLIALYEATFDRRWLDEAVALTETMMAEFADPNSAGFFDTGASPRDARQPAARPPGRRDADRQLRRRGRPPAAGAHDGRREVLDRAAELLQLMAQPMGEHPTAFGRLLAALDAYLASAKEVAVAGEKTDPALIELADTVYRRYEPNTVLGYVDPDDDNGCRAAAVPGRPPAPEGRATAYVCEHFACLPPVFSPDDLLIQLEQGTGVSWQEI